MLQEGLWALAIKYVRQFSPLAVNQDGFVDIFTSSFVKRHRNYVQNDTPKTAQDWKKQTCRRKHLWARTGHRRHVLLWGFRGGVPKIKYVVVSTAWSRRPVLSTTTCQTPRGLDGTSSFGVFAVSTEGRMDVHLLVTLGDLIWSPQIITRRP